MSRFTVEHFAITNLTDEQKEAIKTTANIFKHQNNCEDNFHEGFAQGKEYLKKKITMEIEALMHFYSEDFQESGDVQSQGKAVICSSLIKSLTGY